MLSSSGSILSLLGISKKSGLDVMNRVDPLFPSQHVIHLPGVDLMCEPFRFPAICSPDKILGRLVVIVLSPLIIWNEVELVFTSKGKFRMAYMFALSVLYQSFLSRYRLSKKG